MMGQSEEDWDDTVIMKIFHDSVKRHRTTVATAENGPSSQPVALSPPISASSSSNKNQRRDASPKKQVSFGASAQTSSSSMKSAIDSYYQSHTRQSLLDSNISESIGGESSHNSSNFQQENQSQHYQPPPVGIHISDALVDDSLQTMLMAWYQSGYATGRYQTLCELRERATNTGSNNHNPDSEDKS